jgi:hypothetical protein
MAAMPIKSEIMANVEVDTWQTTSYSLPPENVVVLTKIEDANGVRNEAELKLIGRLWFVKDGSMYVYYRPTHWKHK